MINRVWACVFVVVATVSCTPASAIAQQERDIAAEPDKFTLGQVVDIATKALRESEIKFSQSEICVRKEPEGWSVLITRLPATPGGFTGVVVSDEGEVKEIVRGM